MDLNTIDYPYLKIEEDEKTVYGEQLMTTDSGKNEHHMETFVSNTTAFYFKVLVYISLSAFVSIIGIVANSINITVFIRQGIFKDGGSPSLLGLAVSDLCCVISMLWLSISFALVVADPPGLSWNPWDITYLAAGWPHLMCAQITRMVTAFVAFERCICVVFPFKVKTLLTPRRSIIIIACIFVCCGLSYSPVYITEQLKWKNDPNTNTTRLLLVSAPNWKVIVNMMFYMNSIFFNIGSVAIVFTCTMITVSRVKLSKSWRQSMATESSSKTEPQSTDNQDLDSKQKGHTQSNQMSKSKVQKEKRLIRMIIFISCTFLICYSPDVTFLIMNLINPEIRIAGKYENLAMVMYSFTFLMETINSSINIVIYYTMSSKYKEEFRILLGLKGA